MLIGALGLGMIFGTLTGAAALMTGQSFLTALWLYASVGMVSTLTITLVLYAFCDRPRYMGEAAEGRSAQ